MAFTQKMPSGTFRGVFRDRDGKRHYVGPFPHKTAALEAATEGEVDSRKIGYRDPSRGAILMSDWVLTWWPTRAVEPGTLKVDANRRDKYLLARWGDVPLAEITRHDVQAWAAELQRTKLAPATVQRILSLLSGSLAAAVDAEKIDANPASRIKIVKGQVRAERYLTHAEFAAIIENMPTAFDKALATILVGTGMRWSEAIGLQVPRVDVERMELRVAEVWDDRMKRLKLYPKGKKPRDIPILEWVLAELEPLIADRTTGFVFDQNGSLPDSHNWRARVWAPAVKAAKIGHVRIHDLRHTFASWLIQAGYSLAEIGQLLGHVSTATTAIYAHLMPADHGRFVAAMPDPVKVSQKVSQSSAITRIAPLRLVTS